MDSSGQHVYLAACTCVMLVMAAPTASPLALCSWPRSSRVSPTENESCTKMNTAAGGARTAKSHEEGGADWPAAQHCHQRATRQPRLRSSAT